MGRGVSLGVVREGWGMSEEERRRYLMQFNSHDATRSGYISGEGGREDVWMYILLQ